MNFNDKSGWVFDLPDTGERIVTNPVLSGGVITPGLIDAHTHLIMSTIGILELTTSDPNYPQLRAAAAGAQAIAEAADRPADWVMSGIVGAAGLVPGMRALAHGASLALANKESLVTAGELLLATARVHGATILPVDSEHSAIFQALVGEDLTALDRIILTASGGALRDWPLERSPYRRRFSRPCSPASPRLPLPPCTRRDTACVVLLREGGEEEKRG